MVRIHRNTHWKHPMFCKKGSLKNFANFIGKNQCRNLFLVKFQVFRKGLQRRYFPKHLQTNASKCTYIKIKNCKCEGRGVAGKNLLFKIKKQSFAGVLRNRCS